MSAPALVTPLRELAAQLLNSESPRCIWAPGGTQANGAFDRLFPRGIDPRVLTRVLAAHGNAAPAEFEHRGFRYALTPLGSAEERIVFLDVAEETLRIQSGALASLPQLLRAANLREPTLSDIRSFMDVLSQTQEQLFDGAMLFLSRSRQPFVLVHEQGVHDIQPRAWLRWPLDRLFTARRSCVITVPSGERRGLAVPFTTLQGHRWVVLAPLRADPPLTQAEQLLLETIEALALSSPEAGTPLRQYELDSVTAAPLLAAPRFLWFGAKTGLRDALEQLLLRREWQLDCASSLGEVWQALERNGTDIVLVDGASAPDPFPVLRAIRNAAGATNVAVIFFGDRPATPELDLLVERWVSAGASRDEIFRVIKETVRLIPQRRREALRSAVARFWTPMIESRNCSDLARTIANAAHEAGAEWCAVHLFDRLGNVYAAQWPQSARSILDVAPTTFISGYAVMRSDIDDEFYDEITEDPAARARLQALSPLSGASIPIAEAGRTIGTLFALSRERRMSDAEFEAFTALSDSAALAFVHVQTRLVRSQTLAFSESPHWSQLVLGGYRIDAFRGDAARSCIRAASIGAGLAGIVAVSSGDPQAALEAAERILHEIEMLAARDGAMEPSDLLALIRERDLRGAFAAVISGADSRMTYASVRYPAPVQIATAGPVPALDREEGTRCATVPIRPRSVMLLCDNSTAALLDAARLVSLVQNELRCGSDNPLLRVVADFQDAGDLAIAAITKPNFGAER